VKFTGKCTQVSSVGHLPGWAFSRSWKLLKCEGHSFFKTPVKNTLRHDPPGRGHISKNAVPAFAYLLIMYTVSVMLYDERSPYFIVSVFRSPDIFLKKL
jgi:hypothetical protein